MSYLALRAIAVRALVVVSFIVGNNSALLAEEASVAAALDAYFDDRFEPDAEATAQLIEELQAAGIDAAALEELIRGGRASYPAPPAKKPEQEGLQVQVLPLQCDHVDHETRYILFVPSGYDAAKPAPLLVVGHGGSSERDLNFGARAALGGLVPWLALAEREGIIIIAPLTDRGWGAIGNSILFSAISKASRDFNVDPNRVYLTGHSMGGHLSWRTSYTFPDRFAAISPMSGGYDFVESKTVYNCINVPGYATWGTQEPYQINEFNRKISEWMQAHNYPWKNQEKEGGHEIFADEIPKVWDFFAANPRNLYRPMVFVRASGTMVQDRAEEKLPRWNKQNTWREGRPIHHSTVHWLRLHPLPADTPEEQSVQTIRGEVQEGNTISLTAENAQRATIYLHPRMIDFSRPVRVVVNGEEVFAGRVEPDLTTMLEQAREFDDRGRVFWAKLEVEIKSSQEVGEPKL